MAERVTRRRAVRTSIAPEPEARQTEEEAERTKRAYETGDWHLRNLVQFANGLSSGGAIGVTLFVGGVVISGLLIGGSEYFELYGREYASGFEGFDEEVVNRIAAQYHDLGEQVYKEDKEDGDRDLRPPPSYIHLKEAHVIDAQGLFPSNRGLLWRGRIEEIDGWSLGVLSGNRPPS